MVSREAPLDSTCRIYAFTINVSPKKILSNKITYGSQTHKEQQETLQIMLGGALHASGHSAESSKLQFEYELTKAKMTHMHGMIECSDKVISKIQQYIHRRLGFPKLDPNIVFKYSQTLLAPHYWNSYMRKEVTDDAYIPLAPMAGLIPEQ